jgi:WD40 repeat protein
VRWSDLIFSPEVISKAEGAVIAAAVIGIYKFIQDGLRNRQLIRRLAEDHYTPAEIKNRAADNRATYVRPDCQDNNPADSGPGVNRRPIFQEVDRLLDADQPARFTLILADTGMGKSTFLEQYYAYRWRSPKRSKRFKPIVIPLNGLDADELIKGIVSQARGETVLLLDALDEDNAAIANFAHRFGELVKLAGKFRAVVVTCRTQFLTDVASVLDRIVLPPLNGPMSLSAMPDGDVQYLYLSPFSDAQVKKYIASLRFPFWRRRALRARARQTAERFKDLMARPLLLKFIQVLAVAPEEPKYSFQAYRIIVKSWLEFERSTKKRLTIPPEKLLGFSEEFAVSLFSTGRDRAPAAELQSMAKRFGVGPVFREVRERSLLHNDAEGNWKFAHRSIMEYLVVVATSKLKAPKPWTGKPWTDQMRKFAREMLVSRECKCLPGADLDGIDLKGVDLSSVDLSGANLSGANLTNSRLSGTNLSGANLHGLDLRGFDLSSVDLSGADLRGVKLNDARLNGTNLRDANLTEACLVNASLDRANLRGACLDRTDLSGVDLGKVRGLTLLQAASAIADHATTWPVRALAGHSDRVLGVAVTPDGRRAVSASKDKTLKVWDLVTGSELRTLTGHSGSVNGVAVTPDGRCAVSASDDATLKVWDLESGGEVRTLAGHSKPVNAVAVTPDGRRAVSASKDKTLKVWDLESGGEVRTLTNWGLGVIWVFGVAVTPDGRRAVSASEDKTLKVWDLETCGELRTLRRHFSPVWGVAVTPDGRRAISASEDKTLKVWDLEAATEDKTLNLWGLETGRDLLTLRGHSDSVWGVAVTPDGRSFVSASADQTLRVWFPPDEPASSPK